MLMTIFDSESDGFVEQADKLWCIATLSKPTEGGEVTESLYPPDKVKVGLSALHLADVLVGHNIKKHDLPLFKKLYGWEPKSHQIVIDTLTFSRMLFPKRPNPIGYTGKAPHSIEAWGYRVGMSKPDHTDWTQYSDDMGTRCVYDTKINALVLEELEREAGNLSSYYERLGHSQCA